jgi:Zn-dependent M28 family amino/carboxypeptidase
MTRAASTSRSAIRRMAFVAYLVLPISAAGVARQQATVDVVQLFKDLDVLAADDMTGRLPGTPGGDKARAYLVGRFREVGLQPIDNSFERPFKFGGADNNERAGTNIIGVIRGQRSPGSYIAVTAHYDHLGVRTGQIFNGADDNASGVAALLAVAAHFTRQPPDHSLLLAALDAEELGLHGARDLVKRPPVPLSSIVMNVNLDMLGRDSANRLFAVGTHHYPFLKPYLESVAQPPVTLVFGHDSPASEDWTRDSDHFPFHEAGIPFVYFGVEDYEQHHQPTDDAATIMKNFFAGAAATVVAAVRSLDANLDAIAKRRKGAKGG